MAVLTTKRWTGPPLTIATAAAAIATTERGTRPPLTIPAAAAIATTERGTRPPLTIAAAAAIVATERGDGPPLTIAAAAAALTIKPGPPLAVAAAALTAKPGPPLTAAATAAVVHVYIDCSGGRHGRNRRRRPWQCSSQASRNQQAVASSGSGCGGCSGSSGQHAAMHRYCSCDGAPPRSSGSSHPPHDTQRRRHPWVVGWLLGCLVG